jgi:hypothetical protein
MSSLSSVSLALTGSAQLVKEMLEGKKFLDGEPVKTNTQQGRKSAAGLPPKPWTLRRLGFSYPKESREPSAIHTRV